MTNPASPTEPQAVNPFARVALPHGLSRWIPALAALKTYQRSWLPKDIIAGLVLTAILVPVGMGYAEAAGLPAIYGLYATIVPLIAYAIFGPSRILVLGPDSSLAAIIAATIVPLAAGDPDRLVALAGALALMTGASVHSRRVGKVRLHHRSAFQARPHRLSERHRAHRAHRPVAKNSGLLVERGKPDSRIDQPGTGCGAGPDQLDDRCDWRHVSGDRVDLQAQMAQDSRRVDCCGRRNDRGGCVRSGDGTGVSVVGPLPQGLPSFQIPIVSLADLSALAAGAIAITLVSFADTSVLSRTFALRGGYEVDGNQELIALGAANVAAGFFQGFSISSSSSRTPVAESAGSKTQLTGVVGAVCIALLLVFAPSLLQNLPNAALGAVVIAACISLVDIQGVVRLYQSAPLGVCFLNRVFSGCRVNRRDSRHLYRDRTGAAGLHLARMATV